MNKIKELFENAIYGEASAQTELGIRYLKGDGCIRDFEKGRYWLKKAACNGDTRALRVLAIYFQFGAHGFPQNQDIANHWWYKHFTVLHALASVGNEDAIDYFNSCSEILRKKE